MLWINCDSGVPIKLEYIDLFILEENSQAKPALWKKSNARGAGGRLTAIPVVGFDKPQWSSTPPVLLEYAVSVLRQPGGNKDADFAQALD